MMGMVVSGSWFSYGRRSSRSLELHSSGKLPSHTDSSTDELAGFPLWSSAEKNSAIASTPFQSLKPSPTAESVAGGRSEGFVPGPSFPEHTYDTTSPAAAQHSDTCPREPNMA